MWIRLSFTDQPHPCTGICMTTMGLVHNFGGLMTARWFLGITEAGLFPGRRAERRVNALSDIQ